MKIGVIDRLCRWLSGTPAVRRQSGLHVRSPRRQPT